MTRPQTEILLIDRDADFCKRLRDSLAKHGCNVRVAKDAQDCIRLAKQAATSGLFDMILVDLAYLTGEGANHSGAYCDLLAVLAEITPKMPITVIADFEEVYEASRTLRRGAHTYLFRPVTADDIWKLVSADRSIEAIRTDKGWLFQLVGNDLDVGISVIDRDFRIRYLNEQQKKIIAPRSRPCGICWVESDRVEGQKCPCPWCAVKRTFEDGQPHTQTTISDVNGKKHFFRTTAFPIKVDNAGEMVTEGKEGTAIAAVEVVRDITDLMSAECRAAILEGGEAFRRQMEAMLQRICHLGFDRARLYIQTRDPRYLEGFAAYGYHRINIHKVRLDYENDPYFRLTKKADKHQYYDGSGPPCAVPFRDPRTPWIEVPLKVPSTEGDGKVFVGKISLDNVTTGEDLKHNNLFWHFLDDYAAVLAPLIAEARDHWMRDERARQIRALHMLDRELVNAEHVEGQMVAIVEATQSLLEPDGCHIRLAEGKKLKLMAQGGLHDWKGVRPIVHVDNDKETSVSAALVASGEPRRLLHQKELQDQAKTLRKRGMPDAAAHFAELESCGVLALQGPQGTIIGTLVIDSKRSHFFDDEKIRLTEDLVHRAQVHLESHLRAVESDARAHQVEVLLDTIPYLVAVMDTEAKILLTNKAWKQQIDELPPGAVDRATRHADVSRCAGDKLTFQNSINAVFRRGKPENLIAKFSTAAGPDRQMDVTLAPFETDGNKVRTVVVVLSEVSDWLTFDKLSKIVPDENLSASLAAPVERIRDLFDADAAGVGESLSFTGADTRATIWCWQSRPSPKTSVFQRPRLRVRRVRV